jgi:hypothetical protein
MAPRSSLYLCAMLLLACGPKRVQFTQNLRRQYNITPDDKGSKQLQFYLHGDVNLRRELSESEARVSSHTHILKVENGKWIELVHLKDGTPGIAASARPASMFMNFDNGHPDDTLYFELTGGGDEVYRVRTGIAPCDGHMVQYGGKCYTPERAVFDAYLEIDMTRLNREQTNTIEPPGHTLPKTPE